MIEKKSAKIKKIPLRITAKTGYFSIVPFFSEICNTISMDFHDMEIKNSEYDLLTILGPTASGKTSLAANVASQINGEVISADSRQVYKQMDIGTGKDLDDYIINGKKIPYHLIDISRPGEKYNVFQYQKDFIEAYGSIKDQDKFPVLCGGSGMYIEAVLSGYQLVEVPPDMELRKKLEEKDIDDLIEVLKTKKSLHNTTDITHKKRLIRAIEIAIHQENNTLDKNRYLPALNSLIIGIHVERETRREKITNRLNQRLAEGMIEEVKKLLDKGISPEDLIFYGLEYKFITLYLTGKIDYGTMKNKLNIAIHQFAKRQMTWFRKMERSGFKIHWIDAGLSMKDKVGKVITLLANGH
jgi:tRNA dimethylallyltransferase